MRAIAPQSLEHLLQSIHECLGSSDWTTRKAAADALISLALHSSNLITDGAASTLTALEACRFDKVVFFPAYSLNNNISALNYFWPGYLLNFCNLFDGNTKMQC